MLARCARVAPACMRTASSAPYLTFRTFSACSTVTPAFSSRLKEPLAPLIVTFSAETVAVTPWGRETGAFATLLITCCPLGHDAQDFAALSDRTGPLVRHHALRRGDDHGAHATENLRQLVLAAVDPQTRTADTLQAVDDGPAVVILEANGERGLLPFGLETHIGHVSFLFQDARDRGLELGGGHAHFRFARGLPVADTGQQIGDGIGHAHAAIPYQLALVRPGISPRFATSRIFTRARPNLRYTPRERPVIAQRLRCRDGLASRGSACSCACAAMRSSCAVLGLRISSFNCARLTAYFFTILARCFSRWTMFVFAIDFCEPLTSGTGS